MDKKYSIENIKDFPNIARIDLKDKLNLSACEISINTLEENANVPFVHYHKENEEIYIVLEGNGEIKLDNELIKIQKGSVIKVSPSVKRQIFANSKLNFICIQAKQNSLNNYTFSDGVIEN